LESNFKAIQKNFPHLRFLCLTFGEGIELFLRSLNFGRVEKNDCTIDFVFYGEEIIGKSLDYPLNNLS
jgi:hypothetical protein